MSVNYEFEMARVENDVKYKFAMASMLAGRSDDCEAKATRMLAGAAIKMVTAMKSGVSFDLFSEVKRPVLEMAHMYVLAGFPAEGESAAKEVLAAIGEYVALACSWARAAKPAVGVAGRSAGAYAPQASCAYAQDVWMQETARHCDRVSQEYSTQEAMRVQQESVNTQLVLQMHHGM